LNRHAQSRLWSPFIVGVAETGAAAGGEATISVAAMRRAFACWLGLLACGASGLATGGTTTGLINMPDARFNPDGTLEFGLS